MLCTSVRLCSVITRLVGDTFRVNDDVYKHDDIGGRCRAASVTTRVMMALSLSGHQASPPVPHDKDTPTMREVSQNRLHNLNVHVENVCIVQKVNDRLLSSNGTP